MWCTPGSGRSSENVTFFRRKASVPLSRALGDATPLAGVTAHSEAPSLDMAASLGRVKDGLFRAGGALVRRRCSPEPNEQAPTPVRTSSLYRATRQGWGPSGQPPSWLLPPHSPGRSWPLSRPERHGCHSTSPSTPTTEVTSSTCKLNLAEAVTEPELNTLHGRDARHHTPMRLSSTPLYLLYY